MEWHCLSVNGKSINTNPLQELECGFLFISSLSNRQPRTAYTAQGLSTAMLSLFSGCLMGTPRFKVKFTLRAELANSFPHIHLKGYDNG